MKTTQISGIRVVQYIAVVEYIVELSRFSQIYSNIILNLNILDHRWTVTQILRRMQFRFFPILCKLDNLTLLNQNFHMVCITLHYTKVYKPQKTESSICWL